MKKTVGFAVLCVISFIWACNNEPYDGPLNSVNITNGQNTTIPSDFENSFFAKLDAISLQFKRFIPFFRTILRAVIL